MTCIKIEDKPIQFKIDPCSGYTFLPQDKFAKLSNDIPLYPAKMGFCWIKRIVQKIVRSCPECVSTKTSPSKVTLHLWAEPVHN